MAEYLTVAQLEQQFDTMLRSLKALAEEKILEPVSLVAEQAKTIADSVRRDADNGVFDGEPGERGPKGDRGERGEAGAVTTVNGRSGTVVLNAADVGARPADWNPEMANRNLLDNPWFTVNQRGAAALPNDGAYHVDRWRSWQPASGDADGVIDSNGITINAGTVYQYIEPDLWNTLIGKPLTVSIRLSNGTICHGSVASYDGEDHYFQGFAGINFNVSLISVSKSLQISKLDGTAYTIRAAKLEIGGVSTLQYDALPDFAAELLKCQRYFWKSSNFSQPIRTGQYTSNAFFFTVPIPAPLRVQPSLVSDSTLLVRTVSGSAVPDFAFSVEGGTDGFVRIRASKENHGMTDATLSLQRTELTADL